MVLWDGGWLLGANSLHTFKVCRLSSRACVRVRACMRVRVRMCARVCVRASCATQKPRRASSDIRGGARAWTISCSSTPNLREVKLEKVRNNNSPQALTVSDVG